MTIAERPGTEPAPATVPSPGPSVVALVAHARSVPSLRREAFAAQLATLGDGPGHLVVHTCHRVELYVAPGAFAAPLPELPAGGERLEDVAAVRHLISVACGLDSAVLGETQILHQLREPIAARQAGRALDPVLDRLFQVSLHAGRVAHGWFNGSPRSLADVALDRIAAEIGPLEGRRILVVGVGRMGRLAAFAAMRRGCAVGVTNRGEDRAAQLAREVGGTVVEFGAISDGSLGDGSLGDGSLGGSLGDEGVVAPDGVIVAIAGQWPIAGREIEVLHEGRVPVVDLSSPPALSADVEDRLSGRFVSVDDLADDDHGPGERIRRRLETLISETGRDYCHWIRSRDAVPAIQAVVESAESHRRTEVDWLRRRLPALSDDDLGLVDQMSHRLVAALIHAPLVALNEDPSPDLERAARELFGV
jgi:glutamyl-tRNA reductase